MAIFSFSFILTAISTSLALILASLSASAIVSRSKRRNAVGFFHPYTNDGGGGERVLWCAVGAVQEENPDLDVAVYTGDDATPVSLSARALDRFGVELLRPPMELPLERPAVVPTVISVAQFRPEKAHTLQLEAFSLAIQRLDYDLTKPKLQFVGSCRNKEDQERLQKLKDKSSELNMDNHVEFHKDVMYRDLIPLLGGAIAGLHSMTDEHFGISVVEYMAAGAIPIDGCQTGFLASNREEYADAILKILKMPKTERLTISAAARKRAQRFSEQKFYEDFKAAINPIIASPKAPR